MTGLNTELCSVRPLMNRSQSPAAGSGSLHGGEQRVAPQLPDAELRAERAAALRPGAVPAAERTAALRARTDLFPGTGLHHAGAQQTGALAEM